MFREMRRKGQALTQEECVEILNRGTSGVLALHGDDGYPYAVPMSYVYHNGKIYFHGAREGHKIDAMMKNSKASFCVVDQDQIMEAEYTTYYRSVIVFGKMRILAGSEEKWATVDPLSRKYAPYDTEENRHTIIKDHIRPMYMMELTIEHMTGKEAQKLMEAKRKAGK